MDEHPECPLCGHCLHSHGVLPAEGVACVDCDPPNPFASYGICATPENPGYRPVLAGMFLLDTHTFHTLGI